jgi:hypothetical protein
MSTQLPDFLYHYTSGQALLGILESDSVWASQIRYMNDSKEFTHAVEHATQVLHRLSMASSNQTGTRSGLCKAVIRYLEELDHLALYVACFSEIPDSLSQWRGYCPPNFGYSLGFDRVKLDTAAEEQGFKLKKCIYDRDEQSQTVSEWASKTIEALEAGCPTNIDPVKYTYANNDKFLPNFVAFAPYMKDPSFIDEHEWRLVGRVRGDDSRVNLRPGRSLLVPYVPIDLYLTTANSPIYDIRVGPTPDPKLAINSLSLRLWKDVRFPGGISTSSVPYRDW